MQFLALLGLRPWLIIAGVAGFVLVLGSVKLDASRARGEAAAAKSELLVVKSELSAALSRAVTAEKQLAQATASVAALERRMGATAKALQDADDVEKKLRAEVARRKIPGRRSSSNRARDAIERLRARDIPSGADAGAGGANRKAGP